MRLIWLMIITILFLAMTTWDVSESAGPLLKLALKPKCIIGVLKFFTPLKFFSKFLTKKCVNTEFTKVKAVSSTGGAGR